LQVPGIERFGDEETLSTVAVRLLEEVVLVLGFDAFGGGVQSEGFAEVDEGT
jgi:hypothetical protein